MWFFFRVADFLPLADVDLATAFLFPTVADATSALLFLATIKFLPNYALLRGVEFQAVFRLR